MQASSFVNKVGTTCWGTNDGSNDLFNRFGVKYSGDLVRICVYDKDGNW